MTAAQLRQRRQEIAANSESDYLNPQAWQRATEELMEINQRLKEMGEYQPFIQQGDLGTSNLNF